MFDWLFDRLIDWMQETFGRAKTWVKELQRQASPNIVIALAGNKLDLADKRMVEQSVSAQTFNFMKDAFNFILTNRSNVTNKQYTTQKS